jgi:hypothetical protein
MIKIKITYPIILIFVILVLSTCTTAEEKLIVENNAYLNCLPSIAKKYTLMCNAKEEELNKCIDIQEAYRLDKELSLIKKEWNTKIKESSTSNPITKSLPYISQADANYIVNQITVVPDKVCKSHITIQFDITITKDIKNDYGGFQKSLFIYYQAVDNKGKAIPQTSSLGTNFKQAELKTGFTFSISGQLGPLAKLQNFKAIKLISEKEFNKSKNI